MSSRKSRRWIAPVYFVLIILAIPWYWPAGDSRHLLGFPYWVIVSLLVILLTSIFTAWIYLNMPIVEEPADDDSA